MGTEGKSREAGKREAIDAPLMTIPGASLIIR
jgi:hypothetical protein